MYKTPFHRRIIPWLYVFIFLGLAPLLVFYTAGYRYNPKKNVLEKNASLIVDSTPSGAKVLLDGQDTGETTPVTLQNVTPGVHSVHVERNGYLPWQKNLEMKAEQVTFANKIWLWRMSTPRLAVQMSQASLQTDEQGDYVAVVSTEQGASSLGIYNQSLQRQRTVSITTSNSSGKWSISWQPDGKQLLLENSTIKNTTLVEFGRLQQSTVTPLPNGQYTWNGSNLVHESPDTETSVQGIYIKTVSSTGEQILVDDGIISNSYELPTGEWHISAVKKPYVLLQNGSRWLAIQLNNKNNPFAGQLMGDLPRWLKDRKIPTAIFRHENEIWLWQLGQTPELLWRVGEGITEVTWHPESQNIIFATKTEMKALDLDDRDGRNIITLGTFEDIQDIATIRNQLIIMGTKDNQTGLWTLPLD